MNHRDMVEMLYSKCKSRLLYILPYEEFKKLWDRGKWCDYWKDDYYCMQEAFTMEGKG